MIIYQEGSNKLEYAFYFDADIVQPTVVLNKTLRTEPEYESDDNAEKTVLASVKKVFNGFNENAYLIIGSQDIAVHSKLRKKKNTMFNDKRFQQLDRRDIEVSISGDKTRFVSVVDLKDCRYDEQVSFLLNWKYGFIMLTDLDIDVVVSLSESWLAAESNNILAFNYGVAATDLNEYEQSLILRYFPADNGKSESITVIGKENVVRSKIAPLFD